MLFNSALGQGLTREGHPRRPFNWRPPVWSSQSPDRHSLGPALVWMMALCIWEASSRASSPRQGHQRQLGKLRPAEPGSGPTRVASHYTGDSKQWRYVPAMTRGMYTGGFQRTGWLLHIPKCTAKDLDLSSPTGQQVHCSGSWAATDGVEQG